VLTSNKPNQVFTILADPSGSPTDVVVAPGDFLFSNTESTTDCPLAPTLQLFDPTLKSWIDYTDTLTTSGAFASASATHDWVVLFEDTLSVWDNSTPDSFTVSVPTSA
jgi:hypothetical protein